MFRALHQQKKKDEEDIRYRETEEAREFSKMRMFGRPGHGAPTVDNRKKRFTEHQFDKLRHGGQDGPGAAGVNYQPEEYRPPPPPARRFQEDVLDNVSILLTDRPLQHRFHFRTLWPSVVRAAERRREPSLGGSGRRSLVTRRSGEEREGGQGRGYCWPGSRATRV